VTSNIVRNGVTLLLVLTAFVGGLAVGNRTMWAAAIQMLTAETQGNLTHRVETLARLRTRDADGAIALLEQAVVSATESLPQGKPWSDLEPDLRLTLQMAKAYLERHPPQQMTPALAALLGTIPMPDVQYCSAAMQELLRSGDTKSNRP
jgi:hypothetical protein